MLFHKVIQKPYKCDEIDVYHRRSKKKDFPCKYYLSFVFLHHYLPILFILNMPVVELQKPKGCIIKYVNAYMHSCECVDIKAPVSLCRIFFRLFILRQ